MAVVGAVQMRDETRLSMDGVDEWTIHVDAWVASSWPEGRCQVRTGKSDKKMMMSEKDLERHGPELYL